MLSLIDTCRLENRDFVSVLRDATIEPLNRFDEPKHRIWRSMGVFEDVHQMLGLTKKILEDKLPKDLSFAFEEFTSVKDSRRLTPCKIERNVKYQKSRWGKFYKDGIRLKTSYLVLSEYVLKRLHERSGFAEVKSQSIWDGTDQTWIEVLSGLHSYYRRDDKKHRWIVPYKNGSFCVEPLQGTDYGHESVVSKRFANFFDVVEGHGWGLTARTWIADNQMFHKQRCIKNAVRQGRYDDAKNLIINE